MKLLITKPQCLLPNRSLYQSYVTLSNSIPISFYSLWTLHTLFPAPTLILNYVESILPGFHDFMQVNEFFFRNFVIINSFVKYICFPSVWARKIITIFKYYTHLYRMHIGFHKEDICPHYWPNSPSLIFTNWLETSIIYRNINDTLLRNMKWLMNKHLKLHNFAIKGILS